MIQYVNVLRVKFTRRQNTKYKKLSKEKEI
jgi:hypothetical protein